VGAPEPCAAPIHPAHARLGSEEEAPMKLNPFDPMPRLLDSPSADKTHEQRAAALIRGSHWAGELDDSHGPNSGSAAPTDLSPTMVRLVAVRATKPTPRSLPWPNQNRLS
jgi:hypothetical protein